MILIAAWREESAVVMKQRQIGAAERAYERLFSGLLPIAPAALFRSLLQEPKAGVPI
jgi:hypothetical protein